MHFKWNHFWREMFFRCNFAKFYHYSRRAGKFAKIMFPSCNNYFSFTCNSQ
jgi:hypothetical protein